MTEFKIALVRLYDFTKSANEMHDEVVLDITSFNYDSFASFCNKAIKPMLTLYSKADEDEKR